MGTKIIITTVGTSLIGNFKKINEKERLFELDNEEEKEKSISNNNYGSFKNNLKRRSVFEKLKEFALENFPNSSAELTSLQKLREKYPDDDFIVYLLTSDTFEGYFIGEIIKEVLEKKGFEVKEVKYIEHFNVLVNDRDLIKKGYKKLIKYIYDKIYGYDELLNITGGYKAFIPVMTLIASLKKVPLVYLFENSKHLITIPPAPFKLDLSIIEKLKDVFEYIEKNSGIEEDNPILLKAKRDLSHINEKEIEYLFEEYQENMLTTSLIGDILWEEFKEKQEIVLEECNFNYEKKINNSNWGKHHGNNKVEEFGKKLLKNKYVCKIINSAEYEPHNKNFIQEIEPQNQTGVVKIKIPGEIFTLLVQTTGKNQKETLKIAKILENEYGG